MGEGNEGGSTRRGPSRATWLVLCAIVALSGTVHLIGWHRDLPSPEADEPYFVLPALQMATSGTMDPHWFGHPGSTVIGPLALAYRAREVVFHGAPLTGRAPSIITRFRDDPSSYVLIGRVWTMLLSVISVVVLFFLGRRIFDTTIGLIAALCYALVPLVVNYGRIVRSDSAGACFGLLALLAIVSMADRPTTRRYALAGAAIGLSIASRYFLVALLPVAAAVWFTTREDCRRPRRSRLLVLGAATVGCFGLVTPFFFLDWHAVGQSLQAETVGTIGNDHYNVFDNVVYYLTSALPDAVGWPAFLTGIAGIVWTFVRRDRRALIPAGFAGLFLVLICFSSLHWPRWIIAVVPVLMLFAAFAAVTAVREAARSLALRPTGAATRFLVAGGVLAIAIAPASALVELERTAVTPSTRVLMRSWIVEHVPKGTAIASELKGPELRSAGYPVLSRYDLPTDGTVADYLRHGYHYLVINTYLALDYRLAHDRFPLHAAFYNFLRRHAQLLHDEPSRGRHLGPHLKIYRIDAAQLATAKGTVDAATTVESNRDLLARPKGLYPVGDHLLR